MDVGIKAGASSQVTEWAPWDSNPQPADCELAMRTVVPPCGEVPIDLRFQRAGVVGQW
jgi:hypothetical protein